MGMEGPHGEGENKIQSVVQRRLGDFRGRLML